MSDGDAGSGGMPLSPPWMESALLNFAELGAQQRLGHAYLVISEDLGQAALFNRLVALQQLCQRRAAAPCGECMGCKSAIYNTHGDLMELKTESGKSAISIDQIRAASRFFQQTALYGHTKILLIEEAESMTPAAANSLLKTLEEPSGTSLLLLSVSEIWRLPPTIRSRCQRINLPLPSHEQAISWLNTHNGWTEAEATIALSIFNGRAVTAATEPTAGEALPALLRSFAAVTVPGKVGVSIPPVWSDVETSMLVYQLMCWCEGKVRETDLHEARSEGQRWLLLHQCLMALWSRLRSGVNPAKDIIAAELFRLCRSAPHPQFSAVADRFLVSLGKFGVAG
jgi:hypothetical protein